MPFIDTLSAIFNWPPWGNNFIQFQHQSQIRRFHPWIIKISCHGRCRAPGCFGVFYFHFSIVLFFFDDGMGWGGMLRFMFMLRWWCYVDHGVGWDVNVHVDVTLIRGWGGVEWDVNSHVHVTLVLLRWSWGGVGWDVNVHVHVTLMMLRRSWGGVGWGGGGMLTFMFMLR